MPINDVTERAIDRRTLHARERMLDAAEVIIATKGIDALTLREVQEIAEQKNKSAAAYHFGSREGLIGTSILRTVGKINGRRMKMIEDIGIPLNDLSISQLMDLLIRPHMDGVFIPEQSFEARFLHRCSMHPGLINQMRHRGESEPVISIRACLSQRLLHFPASTRVIRLNYVMTLMVSWLAQYEAFRSLDIAPAIPADIARIDLFDACLSLVENRPGTLPEINQDWSTSYTETWRLDEPIVKSK